MILFNVVLHRSERIVWPIGFDLRNRLHRIEHISAGIAIPARAVIIGISGIVDQLQGGGVLRVRNS